MVEATDRLSREAATMDDTPPIAPAVRATAVFEPEPDPVLRCSHCNSVITDDDAECPTCDSPLDWGASYGALTAWQQSGAAGSSAG
jgi:rubrerythrin